MDHLLSLLDAWDPFVQGAVLATLVSALGLCPFLRRLRTKRWLRSRTGNRGSSAGNLYLVHGPQEMANPHRQMEAVHSVEFEVQRLLNSKEYRVLPVLEKTVDEIGKGHRVMAQTSMGEIIRPRTRSGTKQDRTNAFASVNSKRLDFAIFDRRGYLVCAVEYQGDGHYQGKGFMRDAVKREAVRKAGVAWIEVKPGDKPAQLRDDVRRALGESPLAFGRGDKSRPDQN